MNKNYDLNQLIIPSDIPHGDMPGDKIEIDETHIAKAKTIFPVLMEKLEVALSENPNGRAVVAVHGGSGVGKSEIASILSYMLGKVGLKSYTMSGDNYPHRIPMYNDAERLHIFREGGVRNLAAAGVSDADVIGKLQELQRAEDDANEAHLEEYDWFKYYLEGGKEALFNYLGTPNEIDFAEVDNILQQFLDGADSLWLKRMGRDEASLWYDKVDMSDTKILILEWTHGNSDFLKNVNIPILLNSTPEETLAHRRSRNRDGKTDSPFTMLILNVEQEKIKSQAHKAKIIITKSGEIIDFATYSKLMG
jgi:hypothetical protein